MHKSYYQYYEPQAWQKTSEPRGAIMCLKEKR